MPVSDAVSVSNAARNAVRIRKAQTPVKILESRLGVEPRTRRLRDPHKVQSSAAFRTSLRVGVAERGITTQLAASPAQPSNEESALFPFRHAGFAVELSHVEKHLKPATASVEQISSFDDLIRALWE